MRRAARTDANQSQIVQGLRDAGCTVAVLSGVGRGVPDIIAGIRGRNWFFEIKDGAKPPSARKLTPDEAAWFATWRGQANVVESLQEALNIISGT